MRFFRDFFNAMLYFRVYVVKSEKWFKKKKKVLEGYYLGYQATLLSDVSIAHLTLFIFSTVN